MAVTALNLSTPCTTDKTLTHSVERRAKNRNEVVVLNLEFILPCFRSYIYMMPMSSFAHH